MSGLIPILAVPVVDTLRSSLESPHVVRVLDRIRFELSDAPNANTEEFIWFAREYPRAYKHHLDCADFRLATISQLYVELQRELVARIDRDCPPLELAQSDIRVKRIYWDFESFLSQTGSALDLLVRIVGLAYKIETPPNFTKFCRREMPNDAYLSLFQNAQNRWVNRMKDYRDCFVHYTPVDTSFRYA